MDVCASKNISNDAIKIANKNILVVHELVFDGGGAGFTDSNFFQSLLYMRVTIITKT